MGQKVNPIGIRLGIVRGWESNWYGGKNTAEKLIEDEKIKEEIKKLTKKDVQINIFEIKRPELDAALVGENIANQIVARVSYKRAVKMAIASTMRMGAEGIKIMVSGRL